MEKIMKVGLVGCGKHANIHAMAVQSSDFARVVACADLNINQAEQFVQKHGIERSYASLDAMVKGENLDMVAFVAFPAIHPQLSREAMALGVKAILCEKAMAVSGDEAVDVMEAVRDSGTLFMEGLMYRHHPQMQAVKRIIDRGDIGEVAYIHGIFSSPSNNDPANWRNQKKLGGGTMAAKGCYLVDVCNWLAGSEVHEVFCKETRHPQFDVEIGQTGTLVYKNGVTAQFETNHRSSWREEILIQGTKGAIRIPHAFVTQKQPRHIEVHIGGAFEYEQRNVERIDFGVDNSYQLEYRNMYDCLFNGGTANVPIQHSVYNLMVTDALAKSVRTGEAVRL